MPNVWFVSDTHIWHTNFLKFTDDKGNKIRPFSCTEEMNERIIEGWNSVVRDGDKVYHLGDVTFRYDQPFKDIMYRLKGHKRLIFGNHDKVKGTILLDYFEQFSMWRVFGKEGFVCTHIPIHEGNFRECKLNVHGHIHSSVLDDPRYMNVCVEVIDYTPVHMDQVLERVRSI